MYEYFSLRISKDKMRAYLTVLYDNLNESITTENIFDYLGSKKIIFGILEEEIIKAVEGKVLITNLLVAKGEGLTSRKEEFIQYEVDMESSVIPCTHIDGFVDFENLKKPVYVHKGDVICTIDVPSEVLRCKDIFGRSFTLSEDKYLPEFGTGVVYNSESKTVNAVIDGCVNYSNNIIDILPVHIIEKPISNSNYVGNVIIYSKIAEGSIIKSDENIIIYGNIKNVQIEAGRSIVIHGKIEDDGKCMLKAGRDIMCSWINKMHLYCRGNIYSNVLENCVAKAGSSILVNGKGLIHSGRYTAGEMVIAETLGNSEANDLMINIWENWYNLENNTGDDEKSQLLACEEELSELREQYIQLEKSLNTLKNMEYVEGGNANRANIIRHITLVRAQVMHSILVHKSEHDKISDKIKKRKMEIACSGKIYRGVRFRIGQAAYSVPDDTSNRMFYLNGEDVFLYKQYK